MLRPAATNPIVYALAGVSLVVLLSGCTIQLPPDAPQSVWPSALGLVKLWVVTGLILSVALTVSGIVILVLPGPVGIPVAVALGIPVLTILGISVSGSVPLGIALVVLGVVVYVRSRPDIRASEVNGRPDARSTTDKRGKKKR